MEHGPKQALWGETCLMNRTWHEKNVAVRMHATTPRTMPRTQARVVCGPSVRLEPSCSSPAKERCHTEQEAMVRASEEGDKLVFQCHKQ